MLLAKCSTSIVLTTNWKLFINICAYIQPYYQPDIFTLTSWHWSRKILIKIIEVPDSPILFLKETYIVSSPCKNKPMVRKNLDLNFELVRM